MSKEAIKRRSDEATKGRMTPVRAIFTLRRSVAPSLRRSSAFSFAEVMFAVIILGVGFIMIAALFPVAIRQSKSTADETSAAAGARAAANFMNTAATNVSMNTLLPPTVGATVSATGISGTVPQVLAIPTRTAATTDIIATNQLWLAMRGNIISTEDPRYAWIPFYIRCPDPLVTNATLPYAQLTFICVQATRTSTFEDADIRPTVATNFANLRGRPVVVKIANGNDTVGDPDLIGFQDSEANGSLVGAVNAVAEGSFVIIRADTDPAHTGRLTGHIYRVGVRRPELDGQQYTNPTPPTTTVMFTDTKSRSMQVWELIPGNDFIPILADSVTPAPIQKVDPELEAWIVGRSIADPNNNGSSFEGPAMDVSVYSTFMYCKP